MNTKIPETSNDSLEELSIMTFTTMGARLGVDISQISRMMEPAQAETGQLHVLGLHEGLSFKDRNITYRSPRILLLKDRENTGIMIDQPEDILSLRFDSIRPLPTALEAHMNSGVVWAAALIGDEIILLVDLFEFVAATRPSHEKGRQ